MKTLEETIIDGHLYEVIKKHLAYHIEVQCLIDDPISYINESLGNFNNCGKVAEMVFDKIRNDGFKEHFDIDCKKFKTYFDSLSIECEKSNDLYAMYVGQQNRIVSIKMYMKTTMTYEDYDDFMFLMIHELMHGYEDKRRTKHGQPSIFNLLDDKYRNSVKMLRSFSNIRSSIARCIYLFNQQEMNAYFGTLENVISTIMKKESITKENIRYDELVDKIKDSHIFKEYFRLCKFIVSLENETDDKMKQEIVDLCSKYYGISGSYDKIRRMLSEKWEKFYSKFNQLVPKIISKHIIDNNKTYDIAKL